MTMIGKTSTTTEIGSVEDLEVRRPTPLEDDAKTVIRNLEAREIARHPVEIARIGRLGHQEKALQHR
jgi:hypothetical protein